MPEYFFDIADEERTLFDFEGALLPDRLVAAREALSMLRTLQELRMFENKRGSTTITVRDEFGAIVYQGLATFEG